MARFLPLILPRTDRAWLSLHPATRFPSTRPRFLHGDPRPHAPRTCARLAAGGDALLPWSQGDGDLLFAPAPRPGQEAAALLGFLDEVEDSFPVLLHPLESPFLPNLDCEGEALALLPAGRLRLLLRGSGWAERRPGPQGSLQNRRYLGLALDLWRSLAVLAPWPEQAALVGGLRLDGERDWLLDEPGSGQAVLREPRAALGGAPPSRIHLPWWAGASCPAWRLNRELARHWPTAWQGVELQVAVGRRFRRIPAAAYFAAFRRSGARRRWLLGRA